LPSIEGVQTTEDSFANNGNLEELKDVEPHMILAMATMLRILKMRFCNAANNGRLVDDWFVQ